MNVPPDVTELALDAGNPKVPKLPKEALQTRTDFGAPGYGGPCPPLGDHPHRYLFTVFAVGVDSLPVTADTSAAVIGFQLNFNTLEMCIRDSYERYLALARAEAQIGNTVGAENYYQYAEHYFRSMRSDSEGT